MESQEPKRPTPEDLLSIANEKIRGNLKIFFGAYAGVGKTYAMLQEAQRLRSQGLDVVIGVVETHNRSETLRYWKVCHNCQQSGSATTDVKLILLILTVL